MWLLSLGLSLLVTYTHPKVALSEPDCRGSSGRASQESRQSRLATQLWNQRLELLGRYPYAPCLLRDPPSPPWGDKRVKHAWKTTPDNWESLGPPPAGTTIDLYIALKPHRESALIDALIEVSNPRHQKYGAHLSKEQVAELVAPHQETLELAHPGSSITVYRPPPFQGHMRQLADGRRRAVAQANQLLCASYQIYKHSRTNEMNLRTHSSEESAVVTNATSGELVRAIDTPITTPAILRTLYKTSAYNDNPSQDDLADFMIEYREDALGATFQVVPVHGGIYDPNPPGVETSVDIQYTSAITYPTPQIFYCTGGPIAWNAKGEPGPEDGYLAWLKYLLDLEHIPPTISISYADPEMLVPQTYATPLCNLFAQLGLRGVSVLIASGDHGVGVGDCLDGAGNVRFYTMFPASCPWVTSVGTALPLSGGGFSEYFGRPNYQNGAVLTYLQNLGNQYAGFYNALGRGVPDISAQSYLFAFILADELEHLRANVQTFAAIVTLLNDYLISTGRHRLGFLNLWLYDRGIAGLNDIASGVNPGCNTPGFTATTGWDPVTGLGTPNFERLQLVVDYLLHPVHNSN
ncbi:peptidase S8/S53 domain-containing protein [Lactarius quietus]|nr:peptidase S8/S53 domain-containing protein [Lactarius quietus]